MICLTGSGSGGDTSVADESSRATTDGSDESDETTTDASEPNPGQSTILWGVIGGLAFLVLIQGYELVADVGVSLGVKFGVALVVAVAAAVSGHLLSTRLPTENESP